MKAIVWVSGAAAAVMLAWWVYEGRSPSAQASASTPVRAALEFKSSEVTRPTAVSMAKLLQFSGPLVAPYTVVVKAKVQGALVELSVNEGSTVRAGQVIGRIDPADLNSRVAERQAFVEQSRAALAQAERALRQSEQMFEEVFVSKAQVDNARAQWATAQAQLEAAQASLSTTRLALRDTQLVSPIDGVVLKRHAVAGEKLGIEQQVVTIVDPQRLEVQGLVAAHQVAQIPLQSAAKVSVEGRNQPIAGRVIRIAPATDAGSRSIGVAVAVPNPKSELRAGEYAGVEVSVDDPTARLSVPISALVSNGPDSLVWLIKDGQLVRRQVQLGRRDTTTNRAEVVGGLTTEDVVLALSFENLQEGQPAKVLAGATQGATAGAASAAASKP
jgi:RND family efflux transporter MFP subunit